MLKWAVALLVVIATSATTSAKTKAPCLTPQQITDRARDPLRYRFEGADLDTFRTNFSIVLARKSPDMANDLLLVFGGYGDDDADKIWIVQGFKNGCRNSTRLTMPDKLQQVLFGGTI